MHDGTYKTIPNLYTAGAATFREALRGYIILTKPSPTPTLCIATLRHPATDTLCRVVKNTRHIAVNTGTETQAGAHGTPNVS